jgi:uncharacterized protein (DUF1684 family)
MKATLLRTVAVVACVVAGVAACTSGPPPADTGPYDAQLRELRRAKDESFRVSRDSPLTAADRSGFAGLAYYDIDPVYRVPAYLTEERTEPPIIIQLETSKGQYDRLRKVGALGFTLASRALKLTAFADAKAATVDRLFVPFGDLTNKGETYGGGRYLDLQRTATGLYDLDFNKAYNPYCVYNYDYECPVPPRENRLDIAVKAGEKMWVKK